MGDGAGLDSDVDGRDNDQLSVFLYESSLTPLKPKLQTLKKLQSKHIMSPSLRALDANDCDPLVLQNECTVQLPPVLWLPARQREADDPDFASKPLLVWTNGLNLNPSNFNLNLKPQTQAAPAVRAWTAC